MSEVKIANPAPLGLMGFATTTFVLSMVNAGFLKLADQPVVFGLAIFYGGIAQLLAGMWEFRSGNTFGATAFSSYGAFWLSFAAIFLPGLGNAIASVSFTSLGVYLVAWAVVTGILMIASFRTTGAVALVFILLFITFVLLAIGFLNTTKTSLSPFIGYGGYVGLATAIVAWYAAMAGVVSGASNGKINLPVFPLS
jgi:hypothetical protein